MKKNEKKVPFFAQFLEHQIEGENEVKAGLDVTNKLKDVYTKKYPSDTDEITAPKLDIYVTLKYPSDSDEVTDKILDSF